MNRNFTLLGVSLCLSGSVFSATLPESELKLSSYYGNAEATEPWLNVYSDYIHPNASGLEVSENSRIIQEYLDRAAADAAALFPVSQRYSAKSLDRLDRYLSVLFSELNKCPNGSQPCGYLNELPDGGQYQLADFQQSQLAQLFDIYSDLRTEELTPQGPENYNQSASVSNANVAQFIGMLNDLSTLKLVSESPGLYLRAAELSPEGRENYNQKISLGSTDFVQFVNKPKDSSAIELAAENPEPYLQSIGFGLTSFLARKITEQARQNGNCFSAHPRHYPFPSSPNSAEGSEDIYTVRLYVVDNANSCLDEVREATAWVSKLELSTYVPESGESDDVVSSIDAAAKAAYRVEVATAAGFDCEDEREYLENFANLEKFEYPEELEDLERLACIEEMDVMLDKKRIDAMGLVNPSENSIETIELLQLVKVLGNLYNNSVGGRLLASGFSEPLRSQVNALYSQLNNIRQPRGISFFELSAIAQDFETLFRQNGYFLANVFVPEQDFTSTTGEIELKVAFGTLGDVTIVPPDDGGKLNIEERIVKGPFHERLGQAVSTKIYDAYFNINDIPGITLNSGLFKKGDESGETDLELYIGEERYALDLVADNFGTEFTGEQRFLVQGDWFSPLRRGDKLSGAILQSSSPSNSTYGSFDYHFPVNVSNGLTAGWNSFSYESIDGRSGAQILIVGDVTETSVGYDYKWKRSRELNLQSGFEVFTKKSDTEATLPQQDNAPINSDQTKVEGARLLANGDYLHAGTSSVIAWEASILYGMQKEQLGRNRELVSEANDYTHFTFNSEIVSLFDFDNPFNAENKINTRLSARFLGSYSEDFLPSFEQTPLGGPYGVRAFVTSDFTADSMLVGRFQWDFEFLGEFFRNRRMNSYIGFFLEGGYGRANGYGSIPDSTASLGGYGLSFNYAWAGEEHNLNLETSISFPTLDSFSDDFVGLISDDSSRLLFNLRYSL